MADDPWFRTGKQTMTGEGAVEFGGDAWNVDDSQGVDFEGGAARPGTAMPNSVEQYLSFEFAGDRYLPDTYSHGDVVQDWTPESGPTVTLQNGSPEYREDVDGVRGAVRLDQTQVSGTEAVMLGSVPSDIQDVLETTFFVLVKPTSQDGQFHNFVDTGNRSGEGHHGSFLRIDDQYDNWEIYNGNIVTGGPVYYDQWQLVVGRNGPSGLIRVNGTTEVTGDTGNSNLPDADFSIGTSTNLSDDRHADGFVAHLLGCHEALSISAIEDGERYIEDYYGLNLL